MHTKPTTAQKAKYGGYQAPICWAVGENINGTVISAPMNPITHMTVIEVGRFAVSVAPVIVSTFLSVCLTSVYMVSR
jgi:hypothetical protein